MGLTEFFAMEAGEYLERLDTLVSGAAGPDREELMRLTRALRGSALMANQQPIGNVAAALESLAKALKEDRVAWDESNRQTTVRAIDALKVLVRSVSNWGDNETGKAKHIAEELTSASGTPVAESAAPDASLDTGTRAFVGREGAAVASMLNQAAKALQRDGRSAGQSESVIRSMEPLRGLAALADLPPLPEYLDGVERVVATVTRGVYATNELALFLDVAARGLSKAAQEISTTGAAEPDSIEAREFTRRLAELLDVDSAVVPIQSLYYEDDGPHVIEPGTPSAMAGQMGQMELVAHGEHLCQVADALDRAQWDTQREIRTISLKSTLRTLTAAKGSSLAAAVSAFATVAIEALASGFLDLHKEVYISQLNEAGHILGSATDDNERALVASLTGITETLRSVPQAGAATMAGEPATAGGPISRPPAPSAAAPAVRVQPEPIVDPIPAPVDDGAVDIAASWADYEKLCDELGEDSLAIEELLGETAFEVETAVETAPLSTATPEQETAEIISITELCYSGPAALEQAFFVRDRIRSELAGSEWDAELVTDLIDELLDLVELGVGQA